MTGENLINLELWVYKHNNKINFFRRDRYIDIEQELLMFPKKLIMTFQFTEEITSLVGFPVILVKTICFEKRHPSF
jgi:hypothetical protein